jgi:putative nucleotidyltransferase with HDIG domain
MFLHTGHPHISTIEALAEALESRDAYTAGHGVRVAACSVELAQTLGLPSRDVEILRVGAKLHDIGKMGVPDSILLKPAPLTEQECGFMQVHTRIGQRILAKVQGFEPLLAIVELHHENFDGSGYPYGLRGDGIPLLARIVRVADAFDAMITDRVYRTACTPESAIEQIKAGAGRQFDPAVVAAFVSLLGGADSMGPNLEGIFDRERLIVPA